MMFQHGLLSHTLDHEQLIQTYGSQRKSRKNPEKLDPEIHELINNEKLRQRNSLELVSSGNYASVSVLRTLGTCLANNISEGYPGARNSPATNEIDKIEKLCQKRALDLFNLNSENWGVNVQPYSSAAANLAVFAAMTKIHGKVMTAGLSDGGNWEKLKLLGHFFLPYKINEKTGRIDYEELERNAKILKPKIIVAGTTSYTRDLDYAKFRTIADNSGSLLMADINYVSGLVAAYLVNDPFEHCDIVTMGTNNILKGPIGGMIFYKKSTELNTRDTIDAELSPGLQESPKFNTIAAIAIALKDAKSEEYKKYAYLVIKNSQTLCSSLMDKGYSCISGGTDNQMVWVDLRPLAITGEMVEKVLESISITCNRAMIPSDEDPSNPSGLVFCSGALTCRGLEPLDFEETALLIHQGIGLAREIKAHCDGISYGEFTAVLQGEEFQKEIKTLRKSVQEFAKEFELPGFDTA